MRQTTEHKNKSNLLIFMDYQGKTEKSPNRPDRILSPLRLSILQNRCHFKRPRMRGRKFSWMSGLPPVMVNSTRPCLLMITWVG